MDFNRCGVPLLEIVTQPDFGSAAEVCAYLEKLREILLFLGVSDCKMQEGSLRCDVNLSVRRPGENELGVRTEMKNINSFKAVARAIEHETARQISLLEKGGAVIQETRRWNDDKRASRAMRSKENAQDYRYFPEPDLLPVKISAEWLESVKNSLPELAHEKRERYVKTLGLTEHDAGIITTHKNLSSLFEAIWEKSGQPLEAAHLVTGEILRLMNDTGALPENLRADADKMAYCIAAVTDGKINRKSFKETVQAVFLDDVSPEAYIEEKGLRTVEDGGAVTAAVNAVLANCPNAVRDYKNGVEKAFGFLMGQVMKELRGAGDPGAVKSALKEALETTRIDV
jgi:aspartyl-tRNA(Asn)/glutamyl-tRNA(Gln) amidotransferase subunit B